MFDLVISGGEALTMDAARRIIPDAAVGVRGGRIAAVGTAAELAGAEAVRRIDATGMAILPGLIDAHGHNGHGLVKGLAEHIGGRYWLDLMERVYFHCTTEAFWHAEATLSALEHLKFGVTTFITMVGSMPRADDPRWAGAVAQAYLDTGVRGIVAVGPSRPPWPIACTVVDDGAPVTRQVPYERTVEVTEQVIREWHGRDDGRVRVYPSPSGLVPSFGDNDAGGPVRPLEPIDRQQARDMLRLADEYGVGIHTHAYGGQIAAAHQGMPELLSPRLSLAHCTGISQEEVRILADTGASVCHGPLTRAYIRARCPVPELIEAGANVAITTDGSAPDRTFDLFPCLRVAMWLQRSHFHDPYLLPVGKVLEMVTVDAARALGLQDEIGSLEVGKRADMCLVDLRQPHLAPTMLLPQRLAYCAAGQDVHTTIVAGQVLMEGRRLTRADEAGAIERANTECAAMLRRAGIEHLLAVPDFWGKARYVAEPPAGV